MTKTQLKLYLEFMLIKYDNYNKKGLWYNSITNNDYWLVKALIENGYNFHEYGRWSLRWACYYGYYRIARLLIYYGANVDETLKLARYFYNKKAIKFLENVKLYQRNRT